MNERIKLLAEQAKNSIPKDSLGVTDWIEAYNQKFAELLVQECVDYCGENLSKTVGGALKIHFGVEQDVNETLQNRSTYFGNDI
jgi:hypothetical protein